MHSTIQTLCPSCNQQQHRLFCRNCLNEGISTHRGAVSSTARQASSASTSAARLLDPQSDHRGQHAWRCLRASIAARERQCNALKARIEAVEKRLNLPQRPAIRRRPSTHTSRAALDHLDHELEVVDRQQAVVTRNLAEARRVLVREAVSVFGLRKGIGKQNQWEIAGLPLPSTEAFRLYRSVRINAAISHTSHLLSLITRYLAVALPFHPHQPITHVGRPVMRANAPFVGTTRFHDDPMLWMSSIARADTSDKPKSQIKQRRFLTAFGLLAHSIGYLAHTQGVIGVGIPTSQNQDVRLAIWSILELVDAVAKSPALGEFSHEPGGFKTSSHLLYGLDVAKVVGSILRAEERRWGAHKLDASDLSEGWDLMDSADETNS